MNKASTSLICYICKVSNPSVVLIIKKLRKFIVPKYYETADTIGGADIIVQVDESKFGKRKYNKGHKVDGVWVLGMVEKTEQRRIRLIAVENRNSNTLTSLLLILLMQLVPSTLIFGVDTIRLLMNLHLMVL
ncbi:hypothetical protein BDAP_000089 [Binucleata daphniae]